MKNTPQKNITIEKITIMDYRKNLPYDIRLNVEYFLFGIQENEILSRRKFIKLH